MKKVLQVIATVLLCILPFCGVLIRFAPVEGVYTFSGYLLASVVFSIVLCLLAYFISVINGFAKIPATNGARYAGWLLFLTGVVFAIPLNMNAPPADAAVWLQTGGQQQFRFALLVVSGLLYCAGILLLLRAVRPQISASLYFVILVITIISAVISVYDFVGGYLITNEIAAWVRAGKNVSEFWNTYDSQDTLRAIGRLFVYASFTLICWVGWKQQILKAWVAITLAVFCLIGIAGIVFVLVSQAMNINVFPFMIPAVALAPGYWLGIHLLGRLKRG